MAMWRVTYLQSGSRTEEDVLADVEDDVVLFDIVVCDVLVDDDVVSVVAVVVVCVVVVVGVPVAVGTLHVSHMMGHFTR